MLIRRSVILISLLLPFSLFAQNPLSKKADSLYNTKNYLPAGSLYLQSADKEPFKVTKTGNYYNAACCFALAGKPDSAITILNLAATNGYKNVKHLKKDGDLESLHSMPEWNILVKKLEQISTSTKDPRKARLITTDIDNFWKAYDLAKKDTANRIKIYQQYYIDAGTDGLQDYFAYKVRSIRNFVTVHDQKPKFYASIRKNTLSVKKQKPGIIDSYVKFKDIYPPANFPDTYFVMGSFSSGGTSSPNGLLIGIDLSAKSPDVPLGELDLWQKNNIRDINEIKDLVAHELIHFNQEGLKPDTTLLSRVLVEGMADFIGELISGHVSNERLHIWAKGKEKQIWTDFEKEMYLKRAYNWIANSNQETVDKPADLGYWVGYQICKAYYNQSADKKQAINDILNIKDYREFYLKSGASRLYL